MVLFQSSNTFDLSIKEELREITIHSSFDFIHLSQSIFRCIERDFSLVQIHELSMCVDPIDSLRSMLLSALWLECKVLQFCLPAPLSM